MHLNNQALTIQTNKLPFRFKVKFNKISKKIKIIKRKKKKWKIKMALLNR